MALAFVIVACVLFLLSAWRWPSPPPVELIALGLFFWALSTIVGKVLT
jgi:hypothetical protein